MSRSAKIGSCIQLPLGGERWGYIQFIGPGIHGDAVRVLPGTFPDPLSADQVGILVSGDESFIAQTFVLSALDLPKAKVVLLSPTRSSSELAPWWVLSPIPTLFEDRWVISFDGSRQYRMADFLKEHPEIDPRNLPETAVNGEGVLQDMIRMGWRPAYGEFSVWRTLQE